MTLLKQDLLLKHVRKYQDWLLNCVIDKNVPLNDQISVLITLIHKLCLSITYVFILYILNVIQ